MYFLLKTEIFQPATLVYWRVPHPKTNEYLKIDWTGRWFISFWNGKWNPFLGGHSLISGVYTGDEKLPQLYRDCTHKDPVSWTYQYFTGYEPRGFELSGDSWMYPGPPNVPRHGKSLSISPISIGYLWVVSSPRIPRLNTINTMGTLLGVHPSWSLDIGGLPFSPGI